MERKEALLAVLIRRWFAIDLRALATLRIALALILLFDIATRVSTLRFFYTDEGFFTRELSQIVMPPSQGFWSLYWLSGSLSFAGLLLAVHAIAAIALLAGIQTRLATLLCLVLTASLQVRMPLILTAGHVLLRLLLFWSLFLPMAAVWSVDARRRRSAPTPVLSWASAAIILQVVVMYLFSGFAKWNETWLRGDAIFLAMQLDMYTKPLGRWLLDHPGLARIGTYATLGLECLGPILIFFPWGTARLRTAVVVAFWGLHLGIWLTLSIGIFSAVAMAAWLIFLPPEIWNGLESWLVRNRAENPWVPSTTTGFENRQPRWQRVLCALALAYVVLLNTANLDPARSVRWFPSPLRGIGNLVALNQEFRMFDRPSAYRYYWQLLGGGGGDDAIDFFGGQPRRPWPTTDWPPGAWIYDSFPDQFWRRLFFNLAYYDDLAKGQDPLAQALQTRLGQAIAAYWIRDGQSSNNARLILWKRRVDRWDPAEQPIVLQCWYPR